MNKIRHKRGDFNPETGLYFWGVISKKGKKWDYWIPLIKLQRLRMEMQKRVVEWQARNPESVRQNSLNQRARQKRLGTRNRKSDNTPKAKARAAKYKAAWWKRKMATDPLFRIKVLVRKRIRNALAAHGLRKCRRSFDIVGCTPGFLRLHLESKFQPGMSWERRTEFHIDHIIPLAAAKTAEELLALCHYTNLQPLWAIENLKKNSKILTV